MASPGRTRSFDREEALEIAKQLFWARGYEGVSVSELCEAMQIKPPSLYAAFGDKRTLFIEAASHYSQHDASYISEALTEEDDIKLAVRRMLYTAAELQTSVAGIRGCLLQLAATNLSEKSSDIHAEVAAMRKAGVQMVKERLQTAIDAGEIDSQFTAEQLATQVSAMFKAISSLACDGHSADEIKAVVEISLQPWA